MKKVELCLDLRQVKDSVLRRAKKTSGEEDRRGLQGTGSGRRHTGEFDCQAETGQSPSEHSEKGEILENTPDCI